MCKRSHIKHYYIFFNMGNNFKIKQLLSFASRIGLNRVTMLSQKIFVGLNYNYFVEKTENLFLSF